MSDALETIIHGKAFVLCDQRGDVVHAERAVGVFAHDTRHLSRWRLLVDGVLPQELGEPWGNHYERRFVHRNVRGAQLAADSLLVDRHLLVHDAFYQRLVVHNLTEQELEVVLDVELAADFWDVFEVKNDEFGRMGDDTGGVGGPTEARTTTTLRADGAGAVLSDGTYATRIDSTVGFELDDEQLRWRITLPARADATIDTRVAWNASDGDGVDFDRAMERAAKLYGDWIARVPTLDSPHAHVRRTWRRSIEDLAALRVPSDPPDPQGMLPVAGLPWFMTVFGRDTLITCLQTMSLKAERTIPSLRYLARLQATHDDVAADAEPGKILHEVREGRLAERGYGVYYGSIDSTPLFAITLDEAHRWTGDDEFARELRPHAMAALEWMRHHGDVDGDGYLEYRRRSPQGLDNQSWKDSFDSQRFSDGRFASVPIAPAEAQGYAYDARMRLARLARVAWEDEELAGRLEEEAAELRRRFNRDFWVPAEEVRELRGDDDPRRDGFFALALDADKQRVDSLCSNIGHLLWSGIVDDERADATVRQLMHPALDNGWGVRTMSTLDCAYNPLAYHNGTVWPHDTALCVAGLVRYGRFEEAARLGGGLFSAAGRFHGRLPEVFAGVDRSSTDHPVEYPTASRPQAWAAGAPVHVLTELLGLVPEPAARSLTAQGHGLPPWLHGASIDGIVAFDRTWRVVVDEHGAARAERS